MKIIFASSLIYLLSSVVLLAKPVSPLSDSYYIGPMAGADAIGKGAAFSSVSGTPYAPCWNPAGIYGLKINSLAASYNAYSDSTVDETILKSEDPIDGRGLTYLAVCSQDISVYWRPLSNKDVDMDSASSEIDIDEKINVLGISIAVPHTENIDFGMNINFISGMLGYIYSSPALKQLTVSSGFGWGLDWGLIYSLENNMKFGLSVFNFPAYMYWEDYKRYELPVTVRCGYSVYLNSLMNFSIDYESGEYDSSVPYSSIVHLGLEQIITDNFKIRVGMFSPDWNDKGSTSNTFGIGYLKDGLKLDISLRQYYYSGDTDKRVSRSVLSLSVPF